MTFPDFMAGQQLTAGLLNSSLPQYAVKAVNQSAVSRTTPLDDDELFLFLAANATYEWEAMLRVAGSTSADIQVSWRIPNGATMFRLCFGMAAGGTDQGSTSAVTAYRVETTQQSYGLPSSGNSGVFERGLVITAGQDGDLQMMWNQASSSGTATVVGSLSYLKVRRVA